MPWLSALWGWVKGVPDWVWMAGLAMLGIHVVRQDARNDERDKQAARDAEARIEINETLNEMREQEHDLADQALEAARNPGPTDLSELSDPAYELSTGRKRNRESKS